VIPFLLEAAARFSDFGHSIYKIKEKDELELALTKSIRIRQPETLDSIKCHTFPGMGGRTLDILLHTLNSSIFCVPKVLIQLAHLNSLLCFALASNRVLWLVRAQARQSDLELRNSQTSKST
jgi:hypothetical protein